ncbi:hypothetical protein [Salinibius halmophilus]|uniref:hypothetical protein n=1 Tax=Salinibius halmophilus TaxID=1853216 RepID=UPI000E66563B|nr:hypothetical protein [Salinibius halmophilus]
MERLIVFVVVLVVVALLYVVINPLHSGRNTIRLAINDGCAYGVCIAAASFRYLGSDIPFELFGIDFGWFWYTTVVYLTLATPAFLWYANRHDVRF